ncbi:acyl-CoA thioesterase [Pelagerythrobacter marensis]|uniref:Acyl-CoA thioesterase n=1 Tax=Pelagerythrobacter marensis TaxID=543877 RepID=A0A0G3XBA7_9SPHN|nr:acyl-CoA thioesterase domain-containing protein [Pelagerythrobacter marensis]AKM07894.1 acyl-CoA thioesterase [Pelagerythrobacter marensis]
MEHRVRIDEELNEQPLEVILRPTADEKGAWTGAPGPRMGPRLFGGQAVAQALMAASLEEDAERLAHSLHCYFLKPGMAEEPVEYRVTHLTAGRSFAARRVEAWQGQLCIFSMITSFHRPEPGFRHADESPYPLDVEGARAALDEWRERGGDGGEHPLAQRLQRRPIEIVPLDPSAIFGGAGHEPRAAWWMRLRRPARADPAMQRALLSYASDMLFMRNAMLPHAIQPGSHEVQATSLDHALWFHETPDFDRWHLFVSDSPWAGSARGLSRGHFFAEDGRMIATAQQENLMRPQGEALERLAAQDQPAPPSPA